MVRDAVQTRRLRGSFPKLRHLLFSPVKDILLLPVWFDAILNRRVQWRGHRFLIGRMTRLRRAAVTRTCAAGCGAWPGSGFKRKTAQQVAELSTCRGPPDSGHAAGFPMRNHALTAHFLYAGRRRFQSWCGRR